MENRLNRLRGWRERVRSLPHRERSVRLGWVCMGSMVLGLVSSFVPKLNLLAGVAAIPMVWICGDMDFVRLVTAVTGGRLEDSPRTRWALRIPRIALILVAALLCLCVVSAWFENG